MIGAEESDEVRKAVDRQEICEWISYSSELQDEGTIRSIAIWLPEGASRSVVTQVCEFVETVVRPQIGPERAQIKWAPTIVTSSRCGTSPAKSPRRLSSVRTVWAMSPPAVERVRISRSSPNSSPIAFRASSTPSV